jgi:hypothetical protein
MTGSNLNRKAGGHRGGGCGWPSRLMVIDDLATLTQLDEARLSFRQPVEAGDGRIVDTLASSPGVVSVHCKP